MRSLVLLLSLAGWLVASPVQAQTAIVAAEYYLDTDPGFGNGVPIPVTPGADVDLDFTVDLSNASLGFHILVVRAQDDTGAWSQRFRRSFLHERAAQADPALNLRRLEYFLDDDPGFGNGTPIPWTAAEGERQEIIIDLTDVSPGFHILVVRAQDERGGWSLLHRRSMLVEAVTQQDSKPALMSVGWYLAGADLKTPVTRVSNFTLGDSVDLILDIDLSSLPTVGDYSLHLFAEDALQRRSLTFSHPLFLSSTNLAPTPFNLLEPANESMVSSSIVPFSWEPSADPNPNDTLSYILSLKGSGLDTTLTAIADPSFLFDGNGLLLADSVYTWTVGTTDGKDTTFSVTPFTFQRVTSTDIAEEGDLLPRAFGLSQNYPNPFNDASIIRFDIPKASAVQLQVYDALGRRVRVLLNRQVEPGYHSAQVDGYGLPSGLYFYTLRASDFTQTRKMLIVR